MKENLSAWMDGELDGQQAGQLLPQLKRDAELRGDWDCYHLIGDALRGVQGPDLCAKICARLDAEPTVLAPQRRSKPEKAATGWPCRWRRARPLWPSSAGWPCQERSRSRCAADRRRLRGPKSQQAAVPAGEGANDYLLAHQRYSPSSAMQGVAPYVRTVAEERSAVRR